MADNLGLVPLLAMGNGAVFFGAAAYVVRRLRKKWLAMCLLTVGSTSMVLASAWKVIWARLKREISKEIVDVIVGVAVQLTASTHHMNLLLHAVSDGIRKTAANQQLKAALKDVIAQSAHDEQFNDGILGSLMDFLTYASTSQSLRVAFGSVITEALKKNGFATDLFVTITDTGISQELRDCLFGVGKAAVKDVMKDSEFMAEVTSMLTHEGLAVVRNEEIRNALISIAKISISEALQDESFLCTLREVAASSLSDGNIYRGAAKGVVGALNPFGGPKRDEANPRMRSGSPRRDLKRPAQLDQYGSASLRDLDSCGDFDSCGYRTDEDDDIGSSLPAQGSADQ